MNIYFIRRNGDPRGLIKIGFASDVTARLQSLRCAVPEGLELLAFMDGGQAEERALHRQLAEHKVGGEWFTPHAEVLAAVDAAKRGDRSSSTALLFARAEGRAVPHYSTLTDENSAVEMGISCLNELVLREHRGQGDTHSGARNRVADRIEQPRTLCKRLWDRWRTMDDLSGGLLLAILEPAANATEADGTIPDVLRNWTTERRAWLDACLTRDLAVMSRRRFPERDNEDEAS